jgi:hypothetical protein
MIHRKLPTVIRWSAAGVLALMAACGADETQPTNEDHVPEFYTISVNGNLVSPPYTLQQGQTVLVRIHFLNKEGENLDEVESSHFAGLTFDPATLATAVRRADHHFQFDVTGESAGTGTVTVSYGHSADADEVTLPSEQVEVVDPGSGGL